jgi:hypothetical protein
VCIATLLVDQWIVRARALHGTGEGGARGALVFEADQRFVGRHSPFGLRFNPS